LRQKKDIIGVERRGGGIAILSGRVANESQRRRDPGWRTRAIPEMELSRELGMPQLAIASAIQPEEL
jgi:hypothetical protein